MSEPALCPEAIQAEYQRLGHGIGWRFLTCPAKLIDTASVALITLNPGGDRDDLNAPRWSVENGNAYEIESWRGLPRGQDPLQRQVQRLIQCLGVDFADVLSGYLVPFRSPTWKSLPNKHESVAFGLRLWTEVFKRSCASTVVLVGRDVASGLLPTLEATHAMAVSADWGTQTIDRFSCPGGRTVIVLPHLSRYRLFGRAGSEQAFRNLLRPQVSGPVHEAFPAPEMKEIKQTSMSGGRTRLSGHYTKRHADFLRQRAARADDPRSVFYEAMLKYDTYEAYENATGGIAVKVASFGNGQVPITSRAEILYARRSGHIADA